MTTTYINLTPEKVCVGDAVAYARPTSSDYADFIFVEVRSVESSGNYPVIELNNGHTARWNGLEYVLEDMEYTGLRYSNQIEKVKTNSIRLPGGDTLIGVNDNSSREFFVQTTDGVMNYNDNEMHEIYGFHYDYTCDIYPSDKKLIGRETERVKESI